MDPATYLLLGDQREEALDLVQPGRTGRRQVRVPARTLDQPVADHLGLVGRVIVHDQVNVEIGGHIGFDPIEEAAESVARWRGEHSPMTRPVATSSAANKLVVPWRL